MDVTQLFLPRGFKPSGLWKKRGQKFKDEVKQATRWLMPGDEPAIHPGKKFGATVGGWIDDLVSHKKVIILCWRCQPKFNHKRSHYYKDERFPTVIGKCDGCREIMNRDTKLYIHESCLGDPGGNTKAGQSWTPM